MRRLDSITDSMGMNVSELRDGAGGKNPPADAGRCRRCGFDPWAGKTPRRMARQPTPVFLPGESHGQRIPGLRSIGSQRVRRGLATEQKLHGRTMTFDAEVHLMFVAS